MTTERQRDIGAAIACAVVCFGVSALNGWITAASVDGWYQTLAQPAFNPPDWLFPPAWNTLFLLMTIALWRLVRRVEPGPGRRLALGLFALHLALNTVWSVLFFGLGQLAWALAEVIVLEIAILATVWACWRVDRWAGGLLVPYALWVGFATVLNGAIVALNGPTP